MLHFASPLLALCVFLVGSQDSLLEITFRARPPSAPCEPLLSSSSCTRSLTTQSLIPASDGAWDPTLLQGSSSASVGADVGPRGVGRSCVRLECFRFSTREEPGRDAGETPSDGAPDEGSLLGERVLGALELLRFRESGIGSEYESNTDESDDRDSWGQAEAADSSARLSNVLNPETLADCLGEEMAV